MKNPLYLLALLLILALFVGCGSTQTTKITQKDIFSEIKQKGKYKKPRKIDVVNEISLYEADSLFQKMTKKEFDALQLKGIFYFKPIFYYTFEEREGYYMLSIYTDRMWKDINTSGIYVITYNKKWEIMDVKGLSESCAVVGGQPLGKINYGLIWNSKCDFIDENTFNITREESYGSYQDRITKNICEKSIRKFKINSNGKIDSLSTKYLIKNDTCEQKSTEFIDRMNKK